MKRKFWFTAAAFGLWFVLLYSALAHGRETTVLRVSHIQEIKGHTYVLVDPILMPSFGLWLEDGMPPKEHEVLKCEVSEVEVHTNVGKEGLRPVKLMLTCRDGLYRVDTIWFTSPVRQGGTRYEIPKLEEEKKQ